jgi:uncharacterized protein
MDEGIFDISTLDGFFTAIVSGPVAIPPSVWLPVIWGDFEPEWESEAAFSEIFSLLVRYMNSIAAFLMESPDDFEPLYEERLVDERVYTVVDEWCEGYLMGVNLSSDQWMTDEEEMTALLAPILAFTETTQWLGHNLADDEAENMRQAIAPNVRSIHAYWLARRDEYPPSNSPVRRHAPKVGRNDPCPCGSGKKYKKCCLH